MWGVIGTGIVGVGGMLVVYQKSLPPEVPLWYSRPWGEEQLAATKWMWVVPVIMGGVGMGASVARKWIKDEVAVAIILISAQGVGIILTLGILRVVMLVI